MAVEQAVSQLRKSGIAGGTMTAKKHFICELNTDFKWDIADTDNGSAKLHGVLVSNTSTSNPTNTIVDTDPIELVLFGIVKISASGAIAAGASITTDASGQAVTAASGDYILGSAIEPAAATNDIIQVAFNGIAVAQMN